MGMPTFGGGMMFGGYPAVAPMLGHNEFVVYNNEQVKMRYILQVTKKTKEELLANN
jgi:hypothetical protein